MSTSSRGTDDRSSASRAPRITEHPSDLVALRDDPAQLNCGVEGAQTVQWFHKGRLVRNKGGRTTSSLGVLFFLSVSHADTGIYWCEASNAHGTVRSRNATLSIACKYIIYSSHKLGLISATKKIPSSILLSVLLSKTHQKIVFNYHCFQRIKHTTDLQDH